MISIIKPCPNKHHNHLSTAGVGRLSENHPGELRDGFQRLDRALGTLHAAFQEPTTNHQAGIKHTNGNDGMNRGIYG